MSDGTPATEPIRVRLDQVDRAKKVADRIEPVSPSWQAVIREAIDKGLPLLERRLKKSAG